MGCTLCRALMERAPKRGSRVRLFKEWDLECSPFMIQERKVKYMALHVAKSGFSTLLKDGARHFSGTDESLLRNIEACTDLSDLIRTSYGPIGMSKMVVNHLEKLFVTKDAATIVNEVEIQHPAAKLMVIAAQQMEKEVGDGTNMVLMLAGSLLEGAEELIRAGLSSSDILDGYDRACKRVLELLGNLSVFTVENIRDKEVVSRALRSSIASKQFPYQDFLSGLIADCCISILPENPKNFDVDCVRIVKIPGAGVRDSFQVSGMLFKRGVEGDISSVENAKVVVYSCPFDSPSTETKGTVLITSANELSGYSQGEEEAVEKLVISLSEAGVNVVVSGGKVGDISLHYLNKYNIMALRFVSKFDMRRICSIVGCTALPRIVTPTQDDCGSCGSVYIKEIGATHVVVFEQAVGDSKIGTLVIRGATDNLLDEVERGINDTVNCFKAITRDGRLLPGAGATEVELAKKLASYADTCPGLDQYAVKKYAEALESLPRAIAENAGYKGPDILSKLLVAHQKGQVNQGINVMTGGIVDALSEKILDLLITKEWAIKLATQAATTILRIDQIIMSKAAGGPKPPANKNWDED
ncbi:T-complex protein 1 subunit theta isoform X2 [Oopsacas minuta]|uniref:T-complex protein 1 subunit theta n=1 Tax=Oopsacas minuta TaxID=111878 RepID=A0AAV7JK99_9METZ|nr:T-complex protein 1 subunit theta isoform X2 [Oopsacas minuta]